MKREQLIKTRKSLGLTQADMANAAGVHRSYYGLIENGNRNPTLGIATQIAAALNSNLEQMLRSEAVNHIYDYINRRWKAKCRILQQRRVPTYSIKLVAQRQSTTIR